jgi:hypothetical protein
MANVEGNQKIIRLNTKVGLLSINAARVLQFQAESHKNLANPQKSTSMSVIPKDRISKVASVFSERKTRKGDDTKSMLFDKRTE